MSKNSGRARAGLAVAICAVVVAALLVSVEPAVALTTGSLRAGVPTASRAEGDDVTARALSLRLGSGSLRELRAAPLADADTGGFTGSVVDASATPVTGVLVHAFRLSSDGTEPSYEHIATVTTDGTGAFDFSSLPAGAYDLFFNPVDRPGLAWSWLGGHVSPSSTPPLSVDAGGQSNLPPQVLAAAGAVNTVVTGSASHGLLSGASVTLWASDGPDQAGETLFAPVDMRTSAADGHADFGQLPAGYYLLQVTPANSKYIGEWWDDQPTFADASTIELTSGDIGKADVELRSVIDLGTVSVSGTLTPGSTLTAGYATAAGATYAYTWYADGVAIAGAHAKTLKLTTAHQHKRISVRVTATKVGVGTTNRTSAPTLRVMMSSTPTLSGKSAITMSVTSTYSYSTLSVNPGTWTTGTTLRYQWYADGTAIPGATGASFTPHRAQLDQRMMVRVTGSKSGYATVTRTVQSNRIALIGQPKILGTPRVGGFIGWGSGDWTMGARVTYTFAAAGRTIKTGSFTLEPLKAPMMNAFVPSWALGQRITLRFTYTKAGYTTQTLTSAPSAIVTR